MNLCRYKDYFGKPTKGVHSYRLFGLAIVDVLLTIIFGITIAYLFKKSIANVLTYLFVLGIVFHRLFCVRTTIDKLLFDNETLLNNIIIC
jgi:ABC-type spermidine/putrescine transport system permease subunit I